MYEPRRNQRALQRAFLRRKSPEFVRLVLIILSLVPLTWWILPRDFFLVALGVILASCAWMVWTLVALASGSINTRYGIWGEDATCEALKTLRHEGWDFVRNIDVGHGDVDVVAAGPAGVFAIEVKWLNGAVNPRQTSWIAAKHGKQARASAARLRDLLESKGVQLRFVEPLVVVWGHGAESLASVTPVRTPIVVGKNLAGRLRSLPHRNLDQTDVIATLRQVAQYKAHSESAGGSSSTEEE